MFRFAESEGSSPLVVEGEDIENEEVVFGGGIADEYDFHGQDRQRLLGNEYNSDDAVSSDVDERGDPKNGSGGIHLVIASAVMRRLGRIYAVASALFLVIAVPILMTTAYRDYHDRPDFAAFNSAGTFVIITVVVSNFQIYRQFTSWYMPNVQKFVVRILWMVPLYAVQSWLSLRFHNARIYIDTMRDLYEAFVIQSFVYYLIELLGGEAELIAILQGKEEHYGEHKSPMKYCFRKWEMGVDFMLQCKYGVLQYVVVKTLATLATAALEPLGLYGEGSFDLRKGYTYISFAINVSQMWALYCLILLYHASSEELRHPRNWHPLGKFLCVKGVVFFTWWQSIGINFLRNYGIIGDLGPNWAADDVANALQDYLVCVEMFFFAIAHSFTFTHIEYLPTEEELRINPFSENDDESDNAAYRPPTARTLHAPMDFRDAFWSSTVPNETIEEIKRLRNVSDEVRDLSNEPNMISMASVQRYAESI